MSYSYICIRLICSLWRGLGNPPVPWHQPFDHPKRFWSEAELMVELVTWTLGGTSGWLVGSNARPTSSRSCGRVDHQNSALFCFRSSSALLGLIQIQPLAIIALKSYRAGVVSWPYGPFQLTDELISLKVKRENIISDKFSPNANSPCAGFSAVRKYSPILNFTIFYYIFSMR